MKWIKRLFQKVKIDPIKNELARELIASLEYDYEDWVISVYNSVNVTRGWDISMYADWCGHGIKISGVRVFSPKEEELIEKALKVCVSNQMLYMQKKNDLLTEVQEREMDDREKQFYKNRFGI